MDRRRRGALLVVVVASYRQTCHAYPNGGGAYAVSRANLGPNAALVAASALLLDYVLTVADSVAAGVANIVSAFPDLAPHAVAMSRGFVGLLSVMNLRGTRESGTVFAIPKAETQIVHMRDGVDFLGFRIVSETSEAVLGHRVPEVVGPATRDLVDPEQRDSVVGVGQPAS